MSEILLSNTVYGMVGWRPQPNLFVKTARQFIKLCPCKRGSDIDKLICDIFKAESEEMIQIKLGRLFARIPNLSADRKSFSNIIGGVIHLEEIVLNNGLTSAIFSQSMIVVNENYKKFNPSYVEKLVYENIVNIIMNEMSLGESNVVWPDPEANKSEFKDVMKLNYGVIEKICSNY